MPATRKTKSAPAAAAPRNTPAPARQREKPSKPEDESRRNELIAKSARLFREKGYDKTTVRDIAAAVGMQAGSWFYHFKTKQDILVAIMEQGMARSLRRDRGDRRTVAAAARGVPRIGAGAPEDAAGTEPRFHPGAAV